MSSSGRCFLESIKPKSYFMRFRLLLFICLLLNLTNISAKVINGVVTDAITHKLLSNVNIHLKKAELGTISNTLGQFIVDAPLNDTIVFSAIGYETHYLPMHKMDTTLVQLIPKSYYLKSLNIIGEEGFPSECESDLFPGGKPKFYSPIASPITFWYYVFNKHEKAKRRFRKRYEYNKRMANVMSYYSRELIVEFAGYSGAELDSCVIYCNKHIRLEEDDTEFIVKHKLLEVLSAYERDKKSKY